MRKSDSSFFLRHSSKRWLPRITSAAVIQTEPVGRRRSTTDVEVWHAAQARSQRTASLANACRRHSNPGIPAGSGMQAAARLDSRSSPQLGMLQSMKRQSMDSWAAHAASADARDGPTEAVSGFLGRPSGRGLGLAAATLKTLAENQKPCAQEELLGSGLDDARGEETGPSPASPRVSTSEDTRAPSPHASTSENTQVPSVPVSASDGAQAPGGDGAQAPDDLKARIPLAATLPEIYSVYADDDVGVPERFMRLAFKRFAIDGDIQRERLHDALIFLGFLTTTRERSLGLSVELSGFDNFDFVDFCDYVGKFANAEHAAVRRAADACAAGRSLHGGAAAPDAVRRFLLEAGVYLPYSRAEQARREAGLDDVRPEDMSTKDLMLTLAACRMREGFSSQEVTRAHEIFNGLAKLPQVSSTGWGPLTDATGLVKGLLKLLGLYSKPYVSSLEGTLPSDSAEQQGVCFYEFLVWARRLRDIMMQDLWGCFQEFDTGVSGAVQLDVAVRIVQRFGISLLAASVDDLLSDLGLPRDAPLDFHALVRFLGAAYRTHGFSHAEFEGLRAAFQKFDYNQSGELEHLEVLALLRYNGYTTNLEQENVLMRRVDFNMNGSMDLDEFLRLMRLTREEVIGVARKAFDGLSDCAGWLPQGKVKEALAKVHLVPRLAMLAELLHEMPAEVSFSQFMQVHDQCRVRVNLEFRKHGGFSDDALGEITRLWNCGGVSKKKKFATVCELIWMFADSRVAPVTTRDGREELLRRVETARAAAVAAGVPEEEVTHAGTTDIGFHTFLHLIRGMVNTLEQDVVTREHEAMAFANITPKDAAEFRSAFVDFAAQEAGWYQPVAMADKLLSQLTAVSAISESSLPHLMKSIGLRMPSSKMNDLKTFLAQNRSQNEEDDQSIQFATFVRMLGWVSDTDFAGTSAHKAYPTRAMGA